MQERAYGCIPSVIDGTEYIVEVDDKIELPDEFSWRENLPPVRNQGSTQTCVCQSLTCVLDVLTNELNDTPNVCNNFSIDELYAQRSNKNREGMTFKDALHYLRHHGLNNQKILSYSKINDVNALKYALVAFGPCVSGLPVYSASRINFWENRGSFCGGHAITIVGYDKAGFIIRNSWGEEWADRGYVHINYEDFAKCAFESWTVTF